MTTLAPVPTPDHWQVTALEIAVLRSLRHAGNWLLSKSGRHRRAELEHIPRYLVHTEIRVPEDRLDDIMTGSLNELRDAEPDQPCLHALADDYVRSLLISGHPHQREYLRRALAYSNCDVA